MTILQIHTIKTQTFVHVLCTIRCFNIT